MRFPVQSFLTTVFCFLFLAQPFAQKTHEWKTISSEGYTYKYVTNDPTNARFYKLDNGLTVILSPSKKKPRIQTYIAVKAGSKNDPSDHTGLAHYLEHMLFKGTDKYGSLNWAKEKPYLDKIENLYEKYNSTTDEEERKAIYKQIDKTSGEAAKYAIANEYDKMMSAMGAKRTNAFTSFEQTVYTEDIPNNVIKKYLTVQAERFRNPVFRLFHTELEAVYEEKNRSLDNDGSKVYHKMFQLLFPHNNYGKQTTIGTIEHLKNPSLNEIRKYFNTYYVSNNMGIIMSGDFNPDRVIKQIDDAFGNMKPKEIPPYTFEPEKPIKSPISAEVFGPEAARIMLGYRFPGASSKDAQILELVGSILTNGSAGLIDLNLIKKQKLLYAYAYPYILKDYSTLLFGGTPIKGQTLNDVKTLLLNEIQKLKDGNFSEDLIKSIINNEKKDLMSDVENYNRRAYYLMDNFVTGTDWLARVNYINKLNTITKQDVVDFANKYFHNNYVAIYKRQGEDKNVIKVEKPTITPVSVNRKDESEFVKMIAAIPEEAIEPLWLNYEKEIDFSVAGKYKLLAVKNKYNRLFNLKYYFNTGNWSNKKLGIAIGYLEYLGTKDKSAEAFSQKFYKLASSFSVYASGEKIYMSIDGLQKNFEVTVKMFDDLLHNCVADEGALKDYIKRIKKSRENSKKNKWQIRRGLISYAYYGEKNPFNNNLTNEELDNLEASDLVNLLHTLANYEHKILYYGPETSAQITPILVKNHPAPATFKPMPKPFKYEQKTQTTNEVFLAHYDMVQAEIFWLRNGAVYDEKLESVIELFNEYFGSGMGSLVFQTIRESKALAYSTYAFFSTPNEKDERMSFRAYIGTQHDKFSSAVDAMNELLTTLPESQKAFDNAKASLTKKLASERITGMSIIFYYLSAKKLGRDYDIREVIYNNIATMTFDDINQFYNNQIHGQKYAYCILAGKNKIDKDKMKSLGKVKILSLEKLFGY